MIVPLGGRIGGIMGTPRWLRCAPGAAVVFGVLLTQPISAEKRPTPVDAASLKRTDLAELERMVASEIIATFAHIDLREGQQLPSEISVRIVTASGIIYVELGEPYLPDERTSLTVLDDQLQALNEAVLRVSDGIIQVKGIRFLFNGLEGDAYFEPLPPVTSSPQSQLHRQTGGCLTAAAAPSHGYFYHYGNAFVSEGWHFQRPFF